MGKRLFRVRHNSSVGNPSSFVSSSSVNVPRLSHAITVRSSVQMKRRSPVKSIKCRGDLILCVTLEVEAHVRCIVHTTA